MSSSDEDEADRRLEERVAELAKRVSKNRYDYQGHVELVEALSQAGEFDRLRDAREAFAKVFPLTPKLWLSWIGDEQRMEVGREQTEALFKRAVGDYLSVDVWIEYGQFAVSGDVATEAGADAARDVLEKAVAAVGIHVGRGKLVWEMYRAFEEVVGGPSKVDKLFRRQLAVPLLGMQETYGEYRAFLGDTPVDANVERAYKAALKMLEAREPVETRLLQLEDDESGRLACHDENAKLEMADGNPARIVCACERRAASNALEPRVWIEYAGYMDRKLGSAALAVYDRAVRNCPWSSALWIGCLRSLERNGSERARVMAAVEQALGPDNGFQKPADYLDVWMTYVDYERRQLTFEDDKLEKEAEAMRAVFGRALEHVASVGADSECKLARYWASLEADRFDAIEEARNIWSEVVRGPAGDRALIWLEYVGLEKAFGDAKHLRKLYPRALDRTVDWPQLVGDSWVQFEREEGSLVQLEDAEARIAKRLEAFNTAQNKEVVAKKRNDGPKGSSKRQKAADVPVKGSKTGQKRSMMADGGNEADSKRPKIASGEDTSKSEFKVPAAPPKKAFSSSDANVDINRTVFVSNLDFATAEEDVQAAFKVAGEIVEVRLAKNHAGKSKGFGYVEFKAAGGARNALARDRLPIKGRPAFVSTCDPEKKSRGAGHQFKYATGVEKKKLFVRGLAKSTTKEQLEAMFAPYGSLADVRLVTYRNGHSKGIAYVEFEDEASASRALVDLDEKDMGNGEKLSVAISNPPPKKDAITNNSAPTRSLGAASRGRGPQLAFVPRSVAKNRAPAKNGKASNGE